MPDPNRQYLVEAATLLQPLLHELVFVGGAVTGLLITDPAAGDPRVTVDVDAIVELASYGEYAAFGDQLRELGFVEDTREDAPVCRWVQNSVTLDVMPIDEAILGFSNRWYEHAMRHAESRLLTDDLTIRVVSAPHFLATKWTAFHGRAQGDLYTSKDLEDVIAVLDGRESIVDEVRQSPTELADFLQSEFATLLTNPQIEDILAAYLLPDSTSQARIPLLLRRMRNLSEPR